VAFIALTVWLGGWQAQRAAQKAGQLAQFEARMHEPAVSLTGAVAEAGPLLFRKVRAHGRWIARGQVYIDNKIRDGRAGYYVATPLLLAGTKDAVLVNRGWIARSADYPTPPEVPVAAGEVEVTGIAALPPKRYLELSKQTVAGSVWENLSLERYQAHTGIAVLPLVVFADVPGPGLLAVDATPDTGVATHLQYEITWFLLAGTAAALWLGLNLRRVR
jgi:surfeit locus 1 family protein